MRMIILCAPALAAALCAGSPILAQNLDTRDRAPTRTEEAREIPRAVRNTIERRYPDAKLELTRTREINGERVYHLRVEADKGETFAVLTQAGDVLHLGYPGVSNQTLPAPVRAMLDAMFTGEPRSVEKYERTSYLIDADFGKRAFQVAMDATGRVLDIKPLSEVRKSDPAQYKAATNQQIETLRPRLEQYFTKPQVKSAHVYPEAEGYYWVELSTSTEPDVKVLMNTDRDVAEYRVKVENNQLPRAVDRAINDLFKNAGIRQVYRNQIVLYNVIQPTGRDEALALAITPTGDVLRTRPLDAEEAASPILAGEIPEREMRRGTRR